MVACTMPCGTVTRVDGMNPNTFRKIQRLQNGESFLTREPGNSMLPLYKSNEIHRVTPISWE